MVFCEETIKGYTAVGEMEFNEELRKKAMVKNMKVVRNVMLNTLTDSGEGLPVPLSTNMVKVITLLAMQPMVAGMDINNIKDKTNAGLVAVQYTYLEIFYDFPVFMAAYAVFFVILGMWVGYHFTKSRGCLVTTLRCTTRGWCR